MKNSVLDAAWMQLREQITVHMHACHATGRPIPELTMDVEQVDQYTARLVANLSDGAEFSVSWNVMAAALEEVPCFGTPACPN